jgi:hypothetical protein
MDTIQPGPKRLGLGALHQHTDMSNYKKHRMFNRDGEEGA